MFSRKKLKYQLMLEDAIEQQLKSLRTRLNGEEYVETLGYIERLHKMMESPSSISQDTLLIVGANLLGIMLIIKHEHVNVITSKAMGLVLKPR